MKLTTVIFFVAIGSLIFASPVIAQLKVGIEIRPRAEFRNGFKELKDKKDDPAFFIEQRSRLTASYEEDKLFVKLSFQDVRIWGSVPQINKTDGFTSVHEAYGDYKFNDYFKIRAGRQEISYDNERLLGTLDWAAQGRSHDAIKFMYDNAANGLSVHLGGAYNQEGNHAAFTNAEASKLIGTYYSLNNYKALGFLHTTKSLTKGKLSFYVISNGVQRDTAKVFFTHTVGPHFNINTGKLKLEGSFFYQAGKDNDSISAAAYLGALSATYAVNNKVFPQVGFDLLSGNEPGTKNKRTAFDPLYGTHHAFYGFMDYFYVGNPHNQPASGRIGLLDIYGKIRFVLTETKALQAHYHYFRAPVAIKNETASITSELGHEIDLLFTNKLTPAVNLTVGYSQMFATNTMEYIKGGNNALLNNWAFVMISFAPNILNTTPKNL